MKSLRSELEVLAKDIPVGCTATQTCPFCVQDWENQRRPLNWRPNKSMSLTRIDVGVLYKCFRASCSKSGFIPLEFKYLKEQKQFQPKLYKFELVAPPPEVYDYLYSQFELTLKDIEENNIRYNPERRSVVYTIRDKYSREVGAVDRDYFTGRDTKSITYWFNDVPKVHVQAAMSMGPVFVVEDITSSIKLASLGLCSVALLGTHMQETVARELRSITDTLVIALDEDATSKATQIKDKFMYHFKHITVLPLSKDIKNTSYEELKQILQEWFL